MNTRNSKAKFKNFRILFDSGFSSTIVMGRLIKKLYPKEDAFMKLHTQSGSITKNIKDKIKFTLPKLSAKTILTWNRHVYDSAKGRNDIILERYLLTALGLNLRFYDNVIKADDGPLEGFMRPMVDMGTYQFKYLNTVNITTEK